MDRLNRNAIIVSAVLFILLIVSMAWHRFDMTPRIWQLNAMLQEDPVLADYPYQFRALLFLTGVVTLSSPHAFEVPLEPVLVEIDPTLAGKAQDDPAMRAAADRFREHEMHAIAVMRSQPDVEAVIWSLDRAWYRQHKLALGQP